MGEGEKKIRESRAKKTQEKEISSFVLKIYLLSTVLKRRK